MKRLLRLSVVSVALAIPVAGHATTGAEVLRTVYFSATDGDGAAVTDLTAADLAVKEGGKERAIRGVEPATTPMQIMLLVDDGGSGAFQGAVGQFVRTMFGRGFFAIRAMNPQPSRLTDYTTDSTALRTALNGLGPRGRVTSAGEQIVEAVAEASRELKERRAPRPVIIVLTVRGEQLQNDNADTALDALQNSGASLNVVHLTSTQLGQVLGDGPKRSGGTSHPITGGIVQDAVLAKVADTLLHQYMLTYTLPDGVKRNERFSLSTSRKGVTLIAPSRLPDK